MRRKLDTDARSTAIIAQHLPYTDPAQRLPKTVQEKLRLGRRIAAARPQELWPRLIEIPLNRGQCLSPNRNQPLLVALPDASQTTHSHVEITDPQTDQLRNTQPGR